MEMNEPQVVGVVVNVLSLFAFAAGAVVYVDSKIESIRQDFDKRWIALPGILDRTYMRNGECTIHRDSVEKRLEFLEESRKRNHDPH